MMRNPFFGSGAFWVNYFGLAMASSSLIMVLLTFSSWCSITNAAHIVTWGNPSNSETPVPECTSDEMTQSIGRQSIAVTCCYYDIGTAGRRPSSCNKTVTYIEAKNICIVNGMELCSVHQLNEGAGWGEGCGFDNEYVWTRTVCNSLGQIPSSNPTKAPTIVLTKEPTNSPTSLPTNIPSIIETSIPSLTALPTVSMHADSPTTTNVTSKPQTPLSSMIPTTVPSTALTKKPKDINGIDLIVSTPKWNECSVGVECDYIAQIDINLIYSLQTQNDENNATQTIKNLLFESVQSVLSQSNHFSISNILISDDVSVNAETNEKSTKIIAKIADNDQNKMNAMFENIQQKNEFVQNVHQTSTNLITPQFTSFDIVQIIATIIWIKPTMITPTPTEATKKKKIPFLPLVASILLFFYLICCIIYVFILMRRHQRRKSENKSNSEMMEMTLKERSSTSYGESVTAWLNGMNMKAYRSHFLNFGYDSLEKIKAIQNKDELKNIGIRIPVHRNVLMKEIEKLRKNEDEIEGFDIETFGNSNEVSLPPPPQSPQDDQTAICSIKSSKEENADLIHHSFKTSGFIGGDGTQRLSSSSSSSSEM